MRHPSADRSLFAQIKFLFCCIIYLSVAYSTQFEDEFGVTFSGYSREQNWLYPGNEYSRLYYRLLYSQFCYGLFPKKIMCQIQPILLLVYHVETPRPFISPPPFTLYWHVSCIFIRFCLNPINVQELLHARPNKVNWAIVHGGVWKCCTGCILKLKLELETRPGTEPYRMHLFEGNDA